VQGRAKLGPTIGFCRKARRKRRSLLDDRVLQRRCRQRSETSPVKHGSGRVRGGTDKRLVEHRLVVLAQKVEGVGIEKRRHTIVDRHLFDAVAPERMKQAARVARFPSVLPANRFEGCIADSQSHDLAELHMGAG
jgi:hypothetical protein